MNYWFAVIIERDMSYLFSYMPISYVGIKRGSLCKFWINMYMTIWGIWRIVCRWCFQKVTLRYILSELNSLGMLKSQIAYFAKSVQIDSTGNFLHLQALWKKCFINFWCRVYLFAYPLLFKSTVKWSRINVSSSRFHSNITQDLLSTARADRQILWHSGNVIIL